MNTRQLFLISALVPACALAQERYSTRTGEISFFSKTAVENIDAVNHKATSVFDASTGAMEFAVLIKGFEFEKALMQEHFNENYMESNTYPKSTFKGKMEGVTVDQLKKPGTYDVTVSGDLTIHGVTKPASTKGTLEVSEAGAIKGSSTFMVKLADHGIKVPGGVNLAEEIEVKVQVNYTKM
jgi:YceI-like domain